MQFILNYKIKLTKLIKNATINSGRVACIVASRIIKRNTILRRTACTVASRVIKRNTVIKKKISKSILI